MPQRVSFATLALILLASIEPAPVASFDVEYTKPPAKLELPDALSPEDALKSIVVRPGLRVELVAAEPLIVDPVAFDWGPDGSLWVVEMRDYPNGIEGDGAPGGRVKRLEDSDGDGRYDKATIFLDKIPFPTGVKVWRKGILVSAAPLVFFAEDTDGDGRADRRETLYEGFGEGNQQHRVNGLRWGLDNWLYLGNGDSGGVIRSLKTGEKVNVSGRDLRIRPDDGSIDAQSGQTQFGRNRNDWGDWFGGNNSNPIWHYALKDHYLRRNPHYAPPSPKVQIQQTPGASPCFPVSRTLPRFNDPDKADRFTSACSPMIYRDVLLGDEFAGNAFVCEPVHNLVHREIVAPAGATFVARRAEDEQTSEFLASRDNWFRPSMVRTGPDGALWISDMYRLVIEHPKWIPAEWQKLLDVRAGEDKGRIYRVLPEGATPRAAPRLDHLNTAGLVAALDSPNGWQRDTAQQMLLWQNDKAAVPLLQKLFENSRNPLARLHALCTLEGINHVTPQIVLRGAADRHPGVRRHAVRVGEQAVARDAALANILARRLSLDPDARVRIQLAYSLGEAPGDEAAAGLARLAVDSHGDPYVTAAVMSSIKQSNVRAVLDDVFALADKSTPESLLESLLKTASALGERDAVSRVFEEIVDSADEGVIDARGLNILAGLLDAGGLKEHGTQDASIERRIDEITRHARESATHADGQSADRLAAVRFLGASPHDVEANAGALSALTAPVQPPEVQLAAVASLENLGDARVPELLLDGWKAYSPSVRSRVLDALLARDAWVQPLLAAIQAGRVDAGGFDAARRQLLLEHRNADVRKAAAVVFKGTVDADRMKVLQQFDSVLEATGDVERGRAVFRKRCASCHRLENHGKQVGPDLTALTDKSPRAILVAVLDPNRAVEDKFKQYIAVDDDGKTYHGVLAVETGTSITLRGPDGKEHTILRNRIEILKSTGKSLMPEGVEKDVTAGELADVIAYVRANRGGG